MQGPKLQHRALLDSLQLSDKGAHLELLEIETQVGDRSCSVYLLDLIFFFIFIPPSVLVLDSSVTMSD